MSSQFENDGPAPSETESTFESLWDLRYALAMNKTAEVEQLSYLLPLLKIGGVPTRQSIEISPVQELLF